MYYTQIRKRGFSLVEMLIVAALAAVVMAATMMFANQYMQEAARTKLVSEQAREMYMLSKATEQWMVANSKTWTLDTRMTVTTDELITATFLPLDFAKRYDVAGVQGTGVTPFGARYNVAGMASMLAGKRVHRGVVWETGTPIAWGRYARVGLSQGSEGANSSGFNSKINIIKSDIARAMNAEWKHPAPTVATVGAATVRSVGSAWTQSVTAYLGSGVTFVVPSVVVLAGWPEYGSVLPTDPTTGDDFGTCTVTASTSYEYVGNPQCTGSGTQEVHRWAHCSPGGRIESVPEIGAAITFGRRYVSLGPLITEFEKNSCRSRCGASPSATCLNLCDSAATTLNSGGETYKEYGQIVINSTIVEEYGCRDRTCFVGNPQTGSAYNCDSDSYPPSGSTDVLCCQSR